MFNIKLHTTQQIPPLYICSGERKTYVKLQICTQMLTAALSVSPKPKPTQMSTHLNPRGERDRAVCPHNGLLSHNKKAQSTHALDNADEPQERYSQYKSQTQKPHLQYFTSMKCPNGKFIDGFRETESRFVVTWG